MIGFRMKRYRKLSKRCFMLTLFAFSASAQPVVSDNSPLKIEKAWVQAVPEVSDATAAYMRITNFSSGPLRLVGAYSPVAATVEPMITTRKARDGQEIMGMQSTKELLIPAGSSLELKPGGDHLMFIGLRVHPKEGDLIKLTIQFAPGEQRLDLQVPVHKEEPK
jgi:periplasmic copper chaperone A